MKARQLRTWRVWHVSRPDWAREVSGFTRGKALSEYFRSLRECWKVEFVDLRAELVPGGPQTSNDFLRCASSRGLPNLRCGQRVRVGESLGTVVGHNESANFRVLFDLESPRYAGEVLSVHPDEMQILEAAA